MNQQQDHTNSSLPWHIWGCMIIAFLIPLAKKFVPGFIGLLSIYVIVHALRNKRMHIPKHYAPFLIIVIILFLHLIGLSWSDHQIQGLNEIGIKLSFIAFPLIACLMPSINKKQLNLILSSFVWGCLAFILVAISGGIYRSLIYDDLSWIVYERLGNYLHPTYSAAYTSMAFFILMQDASNKEYMYGRKWLHFSLAALMLIFISMLSSKAGLLSVGISIAMSAWIFFKNKRSFKQSLIISFTSLFVLIASTLILPGSSSRVEAALTEMEDETIFTDNDTTDNEASAPLNTEAKSSTQLRIVTWNASWQIMLQNPIGVGTGDTKYALVNEYEDMSENYAASKKLNSHNQFLQAGAEHGWPGIILLILCVVFISVHAFQFKNHLLINFVLICILNFLFESFLEVQAGIVFFCFWVMVFLKGNLPK